MKNWKNLIDKFLPVHIADTLSFSEAMVSAGSLLSASSGEENPIFSDKMRDFSINLMIILRAKHPEKWKEDWKNEAFLGILCCVNYREEEGFQFLKNAHSCHSDSPQSLLIALVNASRYPGLELPEEELYSLIKRAKEKGLTYESAMLMASIAETEEEQKAWEEQAHELEKKNAHPPLITPNILKNIFSSFKNDD